MNVDNVCKKEVAKFAKEHFFFQVANDASHFDSTFIAHAYSLWHRKLEIW